MAHVDIQHVPYRGAAPVITDLLAGRVTLFFGAISSLIPLVREGKLRALAVTSAQRFPATPELPTMIEAGFPGFVSVLSIGLVAPAGTPPAIVEKIHQDMVKAMSTPEVRKQLRHIGMEEIGDTPAEFAAADGGGTAAMGESHQGRRDQTEQLTHRARTAGRTMRGGADPAVSRGIARCAWIEPVVSPACRSLEVRHVFDRLPSPQVGPFALRAAATTSRPPMTANNLIRLTMVLRPSCDMRPSPQNEEAS